MNNATLQWLRHDQHEGWVLQFHDGHGSADARPVKGDKNASRDELVKAVTDAMQGDYLDGQISVVRDGRVADTIMAARGLAS
jgi:hypothetical protein